MLPLPLVCASLIRNGDETANIEVFRFKNLSNDQDKPSPSTSEENTDAYLQWIPRCSWAPKNTVMFHFNGTTD